MSLKTVVFIVGAVVAVALVGWWTYARIGRVRGKRPKRGDKRRY
ncbi:MAG TPA: hypothetical protein VGP69_18620 [Gaiellaceae bacterium]|nr:hypothetical protein [Gaiellaceae bacterium]